MTTRGKWGILLAAALLGVFVAIPVAYAHESAYADSFPQPLYSNNTGSLRWSNDWQEIGESDGPASGSVQVKSSGCSGKCLVIDPLIALLPPTGIRRSADLTAAESVELWYVIRLQSLVSVGGVDVQMRKAGQSWITIATHDFYEGSGGFTGFTHDVSGYAGYEVELRFVINGPSVGSRVAIDQVELGVEYPQTPSTTTTSTSSTTTTTKPAPTTTTTTKPTSITSTTSTTTSTTLPRSTSSTTTTTVSETTTTTHDETGSDDPSLPPGGQSQPPTDSGALAAGGFESLTADIATARTFGISLNMAPVGNGRYDRMLGLSPLTSLAASFRSVVEAIQNEYLSALGLAFLVAFFAVRIPGNDEDEGLPRSDGTNGQ